MPKDLKIGMIIGAVLLVVATLVISFLSEGSLKTRLTNKHKNELGPNSSVDPGYNDDDNDNGDKTVTPPPAEKPPEIVEKIHIVQPGETINDIANRYFGNPMMINRILDKNPHIPDNYELKPGMKLKIPQK
jgi:LysM repeat protein